MTEQSRAIRISDFTALLARVVIGATFVAHGWTKVVDLDGTAEFFGMVGIPLPEIAAVLATAIELVGGLLLIIGFALPITGLVLALQMGAAVVSVHLEDPYIGGFELPVVLGVAALALGFSGGRFAVDRLLPWGRRASR